jgi:DNA-directed RNA polymerase subunit RPC12/RpoP
VEVRAGFARLFVGVVVQFHVFSFVDGSRGFSCDTMAKNELEVWEMVTFTCGSCGMKFNITNAKMLGWKLDSYEDGVSACPNCLTKVPQVLFKKTKFFMEAVEESDWNVVIDAQGAEAPSR